MRPRQLLALAGLGGILAGAFVGTGIAKADSGDLVSWALDNGFAGSTHAIIVRGSMVCADLSLGDNGEQAAHDLWLNTDIVDLDNARQFVIASVANLCPQYLTSPKPSASGGSIGGAYKA